MFEYMGVEALFQCDSSMQMKEHHFITQARKGHYNTVSCVTFTRSIEHRAVDS